jgi:hypothetical protein
VEKREIARKGEDRQGKKRKARRGHILKCLFSHSLMARA